MRGSKGEWADGAAAASPFERRCRGDRGSEGTWSEPRLAELCTYLTGEIQDPAMDQSERTQASDGSGAPVDRTRSATGRGKPEENRAGGTAPRGFGLWPREGGRSLRGRWLREIFRAAGSGKAYRTIDRRKAGGRRARRYKDCVVGQADAGNPRPIDSGSRPRQSDGVSRQVLQSDPGGPHRRLRHAGPRRRRA